MKKKDEDFERFLKANFSADWLRFTNPDISEDAKHTIKLNHQRNFSLYKRLMDEGLLKSDYMLPELLSGQITFEDYRQRYIELTNQPIVYDQGVIVAVRMVYAENLPNMVYTEDPVFHIAKAITHSEEIGLQGPTRDRYVYAEVDKMHTLAKAESFGVPEEQAKKCMETIGAFEALVQLYEANQRIYSAQTDEEREEAERQYKILEKEYEPILKKEGPNVNKILEEVLKLKNPDYREDNPENHSDEPKDDNPKDSDNKIPPPLNAKDKPTNDEDQSFSIPTLNPTIKITEPQNADKVDKSFSIDTPAPHGKKSTKPSSYCLPKTEQQRPKTAYSAFSSYATCAEDFTTEGVTKAIEDSYTLDTIEALYEFSSQLDRDILQTSIEAQEKVNSTFSRVQQLIDKRKATTTTAKPSSQTTKGRTSVPYGIGKDFNF